MKNTLRVCVGDIVPFESLPLGAFFDVILRDEVYTMRVKVDPENYGVMTINGIHSISKWLSPGMCRRSKIDLNEIVRNYTDTSLLPNHKM